MNLALLVSLSGKGIGVADGGPFAARTMCSAAALLRLLFLGCSGLSSRTLSPSSTVRTVPWLIVPVIVNFAES